MAGHVRRNLSAKGQNRTFSEICVMSALTTNADMDRQSAKAITRSPALPCSSPVYPKQMRAALALKSAQGD